MPLRNKSKLVLGAGAIGLAAFVMFAPQKSVNAEWGVLALGLPAKISIKNASQSTSYYILKQTHEPVFRKDDGQNYYSRILSKWSRNIESSEYELCPNTALKFNSATSFDFPKFFSYIKEVTNTFDPSAVISGRNDCVSVHFLRSRRGYLDFLTLYENAPTVSRDEIVEDGLGEFAVETISVDSIVLKRKKRIADGYEKVGFYEYKGRSDRNLLNRNIKDFNMIPIFDVPEWASNEYFSFNTVELKSVNLIINHPDFKVRRAVYSCLRASGVRKALYPLKNDFYDIQTILPVGMSGAKGGAPIQECEFYKTKFKSPLVFANWSEGGRESLHAYIRDIRAKTGLNVKVVDYKPKDLTKVLHIFPRPFNMVAIVLDAVRPDDTAFFAPFIVKNGYFDYKLPRFTALYQEMLSEDDEAKKSAIAYAMAEELAKQYAVLPLYQNVKTLYYPKELKRLNIGKGFLQYPEVAALHI